ncbi:NADP-dependent oxidoreductase [Microbacterium sp. NPDC090225]|uniref:NADP-dependent oxidoreductase n=1 Tax=Microbacterium sp. NPDC090225 TaxID=3364207 RepID=UPI0037F433E2
MASTEVIPTGEELPSASRRVIHRRFGGPEVLEIVSRSIPRPSSNQVLVRVAAAGVNPVDWKIFSGEPLNDSYERTLPSGTGYDFSGTVIGHGADVDPAWLGIRVLGGLRFQAMADHLVISPEALVRVPEGLSSTVAGALNVVGRTSMASVRSQPIEPGETVLVSGAAGGVGVLTAQLAVRAGARVLGTAGPRNHALLHALGVVPVAYGSRLADRVRSVAPEGVARAFDTVGYGTVEAALALGVPRGQINTIADYAAIAAHGVASVGGADAGAAELGEIARLLARGDLELPIDSVFALDRVRDAYARSIGGHAAGKIVVAPDAGLISRSPG